MSFEVARGKSWEFQAPNRLDLKEAAAKILRANAIDLFAGKIKIHRRNLEHLQGILAESIQPVVLE